MNRFSAVFFSLSLILAVVLGPQTRPWTWGPSLVCLGLAVLCALPSFLRNQSKIGMGFLILGSVTAGWFAWRAAVSPVAELRVADLLLLAGAVGAFLVTAATAGDQRAERIFLWALAGLLGANVIVIVLQVADPSFHPIFASKPTTLPSGFYTHYNECANFLVGAGFILAGASLFGSYSKLTRILWGLVALSGLVAVYYTRSRGGILAVGGGSVVFAIIALLISKRRNSPYFAASVIAVPFFFLLAAGWIYKGWSDAQAFRFQTEAETFTGVAASVMDHSVRLHFIGIALSCIQLHPWSGGGSRSFSWECNQFWSYKDHGSGGARIEYVHNELLQAATDYGLIGAGLLLILLSWASFRVIIRSCFSWEGPRISTTDALQIGGFAGLIGMFIQSSFSFVFHLFPGVLLLGICIGRMVFQGAEEKPSNGWKLPRVSILTASGAITIFATLWMGIAGTRLMHILWDSYFRSPAGISVEVKTNAIARATAIWPQATLHNDRAFILQRAARESNLPAAENPDISEAIYDYQKAVQLHPYEANIRTNLATLLGAVGREKDSEREYDQATILEGGFESGYKAHFKYCEYLTMRGLRELEANNLEAAVQSFSDALIQFKKIKEKTPWVPKQPAGLALKFPLYIGIGMSNEAAGDYEGAFAAYDEVAGEYGGSEGHLRSGLLLGKLAETAWKERQPSKALTLFQKASKRLHSSVNLPAGLAETRSEHLEYVTARIQYLLDAKIVPLPDSE